MYTEVTGAKGGTIYNQDLTLSVFHRIIITLYMALLVTTITGNHYFRSVCKMMTLLTKYTTPNGEDIQCFRDLYS